MTGQVLVLGGTGEARRLAAALVDRGVDVLSSLAGRVADPVLPEGGVRVGGFGGADGLADWLATHRPRAVVDATHPFAARITANAAAAARRRGVPLLRLQRPGWTPGPGDRWTYVDSLTDAAAAVRDAGTVFLTTGRQGVGAFAALPGRVLVRSVDPPDEPLPAGAVLLLARGPFTVEEEVALMREHGVDVVVTKDSGGHMTEAKLVAARRLGLPVVLVRRPPLPPGVDVVTTVEEAVEWLNALRRDGAGTEDGPSWNR
ncbi:cobalt-precorrin-6A reductase [Geodermatophilus sp. SYSU D01062]